MLKYPFVVFFQNKSDAKINKSASFAHVCSSNHFQIVSIYLSSIISLGDGGPADVAGRAIVVHAGEDDLGRKRRDFDEFKERNLLFYPLICFEKDNKSVFKAINSF